jgi:hypothetical protein
MKEQVWGTECGEARVARAGYKYGFHRVCFGSRLLCPRMTASPYHTVALALASLLQKLL